MTATALVVATCSLLVVGCSIGRPIPTISTYSIETGTPASVRTEPRHPERLRVDRIRVAPPYDKVALVYRVSEVSYVADPYHALLSDPGPMLGSQVVAWLVETGLFAGVEGSGGAAPAPWLLEATVAQLYGDFQQRASPAAVLSVRFAILDQSSARPRVTYERTISSRIPLSSESPEALVGGYGRALTDVLTQLSADLAVHSSPEGSVSH